MILSFNAPNALIMRSLLLAILVSLTSVSFAKSIDKAPKVFQLPEGISSEDYQAGTIVIKEKAEFKGVLAGRDVNGKDFLHQVMVNIGISEVQKEFPFHQTPKLKTDKQGNPHIDLSTINRIKFDESIDIETAINQLLSTGMFEYAEPLFLQSILYVPNDTLIDVQYYHDLIQAYDGWDISKGDTNIVIAITDTGIEKNHDDLKNKIKFNYADPINGIDDDGDGYVDNFHGWDVGDNDNDPEIHTSNHGLWVAGIAGMEADNVGHGAGVGYNSMILPVKIMDASGTIANSYNGIVYAADHGADIINCSWGSANSWSQYGQDIVTYATITKNALVVCAAGNSTADEAFYPASFKYALSCGMIDSNDVINSNSTWNYRIDVAAPGGWMPTTHRNNGWQNVGSGSSFSSPVVAGMAAIIKAENPTWSAMQIAGQIKTTSEITDTITANLPYQDKLGDGRVNLYNALTQSGKPYIEIDSYSFGNSAFTDNDTILFTGDFINYLDPSSSALTATIESPSSYVEIIDGTVTLGIVNTLASTNNNSNPFKFRIIPGAPTNTSIDLIVRYSDGSYTSKDAITVVINRDYIDMDINDVLVTIASNGRLGFGAGNQLNGSGISYQNASNILYEMNFMIAQSTTQVSFARDDEFVKNGALNVLNPGLESDRDIKTFFDDSPAGGNELGVNVKAKALAWDKSGHENYVISEYKIVNKSGGDLVDIFPALYADWDIGTWNANIAYYDAERHMGVAYFPGGTYAGLRLLTDTAKTNFYALSNDGSDGSISIYDGYSQEEQYNTATGGLQRTSASLGDIAELIGAGPMTLSDNDSIRIAFAIILGMDSASIVAGADSAATQYYNIRHVDMNLSAIQNVACNGDSNGSATVSSEYGIEPYSYSWNDGENQTGATANDLDPGQYIVTVTDAVGNTNTRNVIVGEPDSLIATLNSVSNATCFDYCDATVGLSVTGGTMGYNYHWNDSTLPNSPAPLLCAGSFELVVEDANGCTDSLAFSTSQPLELTLALSDTVHQSHPDTCNGSASIVAAGGIAPYSYSWDDDNSSVTTSVDSLCADYFTATVIDANGCITQLGVTIELDYEEPSSIFSTNGEFNLYPNPSNGVVNIKSDKLIKSIEVYALNGQVVSKINSNNTTVTIEHLNTGVYQAIIYFEDGISTKRFEIIK